MKWILFYILAMATLFICCKEEDQKGQTAMDKANPKRKFEPISLYYFNDEYLDLTTLEPVFVGGLITKYFQTESRYSYRFAKTDTKKLVV